MVTDFGIFLQMSGYCRLILWAKNSDREDLLGKVGDFAHKTSALCQKHFTESQFIKDYKGKKRLKFGAVPTIFGSEIKPCKFDKTDCGMY